MSNRSNEFDVIIVGSGISGLLIAASISSNYRVALIDNAENPGGLCRQFTSFKNLTGQFQSLPANTETDRALAFIERLIASPISRTLKMEGPVTYNEGFSPFVGFGDNSPTFVEELTYYTHQNRYLLQDGPDQWIPKLFERFKGDFFNLSQVTKIDQDDHGKYSVSINGQKVLHAPKVIFCCNPKLLLGLLPNEKISNKVRNKLTRSELWTSILLQIVHSGVISENHSIHVLNGKTDFANPCIGQFYEASATDDGHKTQASQWLTFLSESDAQNDELVSATIKKIKRHIVRAYPNALNDLKYEKISVFQASHGSLDTTVDQLAALVGFKNFFVISPTLGEAKNIPGLILQAEKCSDTLGCHPAL